MIRVFPRRTKWTPTDDLAFVGRPPLLRPQDRTIPVRVSVVFTGDIPRAEELYFQWSQLYDDVKIGGPALGDPGGEFTPGRFVKEGVTFTSRGCRKRCPWCLVPGREGKIRELEIKPGFIIQDNNLLGCSAKHIKAVFGMLREQSKGAVFGGGLDADFFKPSHVKLFNSISVRELWWACDTPEAIHKLKKVREQLDFPARKMRCYVLIGHNKHETPRKAKKRLETLYDLGFYPFSQLFQSKDGKTKEWSRAWKDLNRLWSRPAAYVSYMNKGG